MRRTDFALVENDRRLRERDARSYTGYKQQTPAWQESVRVRHATDEVGRSLREVKIGLDFVSTFSRDLETSGQSSGLIPSDSDG